MRRFFVWSALAAVIGLLLALAGAWAYNHFYARFLPVTVTRNQAEVQRLLDEASWVSAGGGGPVVYVIGYRDSEAFQRYQAEEVGKLAAGGLDTRFIMFARPDREGLALSTAAERATIAELWLTRDWSLFERWTATPVREWTAAGVAPADGNLARSAVVEAGRQFTDRLANALSDSGLSVRYPLIIWRDRDGFMKACACIDAKSWAFVRDDLGAPETGAIEDTAPQATTPAAPQSAPNALPYPSQTAAPDALPEIPPVATETPPVRRPAERPATKAAPPTRTPPSNAQADPNEDTIFY